MESRLGNAVDNSLSDYLNIFLCQSLHYKLLYDAIALFIASAILLDAYFPSMYSKLALSTTIKWCIMLILPRL